MVNSISSLAPVINQQIPQETNIDKLVKYAGNETLKEVPDTFSSTTKSAASSALFFEGIPLLNFLFRNKKVNGKFSNTNLKILGQADKEALNNLLKGDGKLSTRIADYIKHANQCKFVYIDEKAAVKSKAKASKLAEKAKKLADKATEKQNSKIIKFIADKAQKKSEKAIADCINKTEKAVDSRIAVTTKTTNPIKLGKIGTKLNKLTNGKFGSISKFMKSSGAGMMLVFSGIIEGFTEVVPTFKELGTEKGLKQLGKSTIKIIGDTAGFIAGEQAGMAIGSAIGTAICPGIGTAVGAVCGFVGGILGSFTAGKITKAITGKSEREIANEQKNNENGKQIANNTETSDTTQAIQNTQLAENVLDQDSEKALQEIENLNVTNPFNITA